MCCMCVYLLLCTRRYSGALYRQLAVKSQLWVSVGISGYVMEYGIREYRPTGGARWIKLLRDLLSNVLVSYVHSQSHFCYL